MMPRATRRSTQAKQLIPSTPACSKQLFSCHIASLKHNGGQRSCPFMLVRGRIVPARVRSRSGRMRSYLRVVTSYSFTLRLCPFALGHGRVVHSCSRGHARTCSCRHGLLVVFLQLAASFVPIRPRVPYACSLRSCAFTLVRSRARRGALVHVGAVAECLWSSQLADLLSTARASSCLRRSSHHPCTTSRLLTPTPHVACTHACSFAPRSVAFVRHSACSGAVVLGYVRFGF